jgi:signal peptidase I
MNQEDTLAAPAPAPIAASSTAPTRATSRWWRWAREILTPVVLAAAIFLVTHTAIVNYRVEGMSMYPTIHPGQLILVDTVSYHLHQPQRGDVVVFRFPLDTSQDFIKRVIGVAGDTVAVHNGIVSVNGHDLREPYVHLPATYSWPLHHVPPASVVVLGDNRVISYDSHEWADSSGERPYVPNNDILGRAVVAYWPLGELALLGGPTGAAQVHDK